MRYIVSEALHAVADAIGRCFGQRTVLAGLHLRQKLFSSSIPEGYQRRKGELKLVAKR